jgi:hypothetical protein
MRRKQLIELEDMAWCPRTIRDGGTDWLAFLGTVSGAFTAAIPKIHAAMTAAHMNVVVDLCSGAGGPWRTLAPALAKQGAVRIVLSDLYPNVQAFAAARDAAGGAIEFCADPVDAARVPASLTGVRTMFNAFHHFTPAQAAAVLADAVEAGQPIAIFEGASARALGWLAMPIQIPAMFLLMPFVQPFRWSRLLFTYVVPAIPLLVLFDGTVSFLRLYSREELRDVIATVPGRERFDWEVGSLKAPGMPVSIGYLLGTPKP